MARRRHLDALERAAQHLQIGQEQLEGPASGRTGLPAGPGPGSSRSGTVPSTSGMLSFAAAIPARYSIA